MKTSWWGGHDDHELVTHNLMMIMCLWRTIFRCLECTIGWWLAAETGRLRSLSSVAGSLGSRRHLRLATRLSTTAVAGREGWSARLGLRLYGDGQSWRWAVHRCRVRGQRYSRGKPRWFVSWLFQKYICLLSKYQNVITSLVSYFRNSVLSCKAFCVFRGVV